MAVDKRQRALVIRRANNAEHRPENLFAPDNHFRCYVIKQRAADVVTRFIAWQAECAAIDHQFRAFADALFNIAQHFFLVSVGNHWPHFILFRPAHTARPDFQRFHQRR